MSEITPEMLEELIPRVAEMTRGDLMMMIQREEERRRQMTTAVEQLPPLEMWKELLEDMRTRDADFLGELGDGAVARMIGYDLPDD